MRMLCLLLAMVGSVTAFARAQSATPTLTLAAALAEANARNPEVIAARYQIDVARAALTATAPNPLQLQVGQGATQDVPQGLGPLQTFTAGASQEFSPALGAQRRAAGSGVQITQAQFAAVQRDVDQRVVAAYYGLASAQAVVTAAQQSVSNAQQLENSARVRARVGAVGNFEVLRAQVELRRAQTDLQRAQVNESTAEIGLNVLLGRSPGAETTVELAPSAIAMPNVEALYARAQRIDPQIAQFRAAIDQAIAQARAARLQRAPSLGLQGGYLFQRAPSSGGAISRGPTASVTLSLPLIDFGTIRGAVREAQARLSVAQAQLEGRNAGLRGEILQDVADLESAQSRLSFSKTSLTLAQQGLQLAQFGYNRGALGVLDVLSARNELAAARSEVTQASADLGAAVARLQLVTGVPVSP